MTVKQYFFEKNLEWEFLSKFDHFAYQKLYKIIDKVDRLKSIFFFLLLFSINCIIICEAKGGESVLWIIIQSIH